MQGQKKSFTARMGIAGKTPWDFVQLLLLPLLLAGVGLWFNLTSLQIAKDNRAKDLDIAAQQRQETTLQTYLDDMTTLFRDMKLGDQAPTSAKAAVIARAKTITALRQLDENQKGLLIQFLSEAGLVTGKVGAGKDEPPTIALDTADLRGADLTVTNLSGADLHGAHLDGAHLEGAKLERAKLEGADFTRAHLSRAKLFASHLNGAIIKAADLSEADLSGADLSGANLSEADLSGANLSGANLSGAALDKTTILKGARYNTKEIPAKDLPVELPPTEWPPGFDPKAAGATKDNTVP